MFCGWLCDSFSLKRKTTMREMINFTILTYDCVFMAFAMVRSRQEIIRDEPERNKFSCVEHEWEKRKEKRKSIERWKLLVLWASLCVCMRVCQCVQRLVFARFNWNFSTMSAHVHAHNMHQNDMISRGASSLPLMHFHFFHS